MSIKVLKRSIALLVTILTAVLVFLDQNSQSPNSELSPNTSPPAMGESVVPVETSVKTGGEVPVVRIVDGDTLVALVNGKEEKIRMLGINAPESVDPRRKVECFGKEASAELHLLLDGKSVELVADATQDDRDKYGRLLRYVMLADGSDVNATMIKEGFAYEYTYRLPYERQKEYKQFQIDAETSGKGLWAKSACNGKK